MAVSAGEHFILLNPELDHVITRFWKKDFMYLFLERKGGREREKHQCVGASRMSPTGDPTGNQIRDPLVHRPAFNPLSHTSCDYYALFLL